MVILWKITNKKDGSRYMILAHKTEIPGMPGGNVGMVNLGDILGKSMGG